MISPSGSLSAELAQIDQLHPGWHAWPSDEGNIWATHVHRSDETGCGVTLDAPSPARMDEAIADWEWHQQRRGRVA